MNTQPKIKTSRVELRLAPNQKEALQALADTLKTTMTQLIISSLNLPAPTE